MKKFAKIMAVMLLVALTVTLLVACSYSGDPEKDKENLEGKGYNVTLSKISEDKVGDDGVVAMLTAMKSNLKDFLKGDIKAKDIKLETVSITYFNDTDKAKDAYEDAKTGMDEMKEETPGKYSIKRSGKMIIIQATITGEDAMNMF